MARTYTSNYLHTPAPNYSRDYIEDGGNFYSISGRILHRADRMFFSQYVRSRSFALHLGKACVITSSSSLKQTSVDVCCNRLNFSDVHKAIKFSREVSSRFKYWSTPIQPSKLHYTLNVHEHSAMLRSLEKL